MLHYLIKGYKWLPSMKRTYIDNILLILSVLMIGCAARAERSSLSERMGHDWSNQPILLRLNPCSCTFEDQRNVDFEVHMTTLEMEGLLSHQRQISDTILDQSAAHAQKIHASDQLSSLPWERISLSSIDQGELMSTTLQWWRSHPDSLLLLRLEVDVETHEVEGHQLRKARLTEILTQDP